MSSGNMCAGCIAGCDGKRNVKILYEKPDGTYWSVMEFQADRQRQGTVVVGMIALVDHCSKIKSGPMTEKNKR